MNRMEAYKNIKKVMNFNKNRSNTLISLWTSLLFLSGHYNTGIKFVEKRKSNISSIEYCCWKGIFNYAKKNYRSFIKCLEEIENLNKDNFYTKFLLAEGYLQLLELEKAEARFRAILAEPLLRAEGLCGIARCMMKKNNYTEALGFLNWALKAADGKIIVKILNKKGLCLLELGKNQNAIECFEKALEISPQDYTVMANLALVLSKSGEYDRAVMLYEKILLKFPFDLTAINNIASCKAAQGKYREALEYCERGLKIDAINKDLLINKGYCLYMVKDYKNALECLSEAEKNAGDDKVLLNNKALCYMALSQYTEALKIFNHILQNYQEDDILINKAICLIKIQRYAEALECFDEIRDKNNKKSVLYTLKGICYENLGDSEKAVEYYNRSLIA